LVAEVGRRKYIDMTDLEFVDIVPDEAAAAAILLRYYNDNCPPLD